MKNFIIFGYWASDGTPAYISCASMEEVHEWYAADKEAQRFIKGEIQKGDLSEKAATLVHELVYNTNGVAKHQRILIRCLTPLVTEGFIYHSDLT